MTEIDQAELKTSKNIGLLQPSKFHVTIEGPEIPKGFDLLATSVNIDATDTNNVSYAYGFQSLPIPGEMMAAGNLSIDYIIDENMNNYTVLYNMMNAMVRSDNPEDYYITIVVTMYSSHNNVTRTFKFHDALLSSIGAITLDQADETAGPVATNVDFMYSRKTFV